MHRALRELCIAMVVLGFAFSGLAFAQIVLATAAAQPWPIDILQTFFWTAALTSVGGIGLLLMNWRSMDREVQFL